MHTTLSTTLITALFYSAFICQIFLLSSYFPRKILERMKNICHHYPPTEYPKLYPKSIEHYNKFQRNFRVMNNVLFLLGLCFLIAIFLWEYTTNNVISEMVPWAYFMLQMIPMMYLEISEFSGFKQMRKADLRTTRKAELNPRRFKDIVSFPLFSTAICLYFTAIFFNLFIEDFEIYWGSQALSTILIMTGGNLFFAGIIFWNLYGKKLDPYQTGQDRMKLVKISATSMIYISMGVSLFVIIMAVTNEFDMDILEPLTMSLYCQLISIAGIGHRLNSLKTEELNFDVYKKDSPSL